jgi:hypothetical protein
MVVVVVVVAGVGYPVPMPNATIAQRQTACHYETRNDRPHHLPIHLARHQPQGYARTNARPSHHITKPRRDPPGSAFRKDQRPIEESRSLIVLLIALSSLQSVGVRSF